MYFIKRKGRGSESTFTYTCEETQQDAVDDIPALGKEFPSSTLVGEGALITIASGAIIRYGGWFLLGRNLQG